MALALVLSRPLVNNPNPGREDKMDVITRHVIRWSSRAANMTQSSKSSVIKKGLGDRYQSCHRGPATHAVWRASK